MNSITYRVEWNSCWSSQICINSCITLLDLQTDDVLYIFFKTYFKINITRYAYNAILAWRNNDIYIYAYTVLPYFLYFIINES